MITLLQKLVYFYGTKFFYFYNNETKMSKIPTKNPNALDLAIVYSYCICMCV